MVLDCLRSSICPEIIEIDATLVSFLPWERATGFNGGTLRESTSTPLSFIWSSPRVQRTRLSAVPGGGTWVFFGWVCAAWDSKLAPRSKKKFP